MKSSKVLFTYGLVFTMLMGGIFTLLTQAAAIPADVRCTPFFISLEDPGPEEFRITIMLPKGYKHEDIDPESIRVGGFDVMKDVPDWPKVKKNFFAFKAEGWKMMDWIVRLGIPHMTPHGEKVDIDVTVTGLVGGEAFEGMFTLRVMTMHNDNNMGIPPP